MWYYLAFVITINVISAHKKRKKYREKNYSGRYRIIEIVNDRPAYKVSSQHKNDFYGEPYFELHTASVGFGNMFFF